MNHNSNDDGVEESLYEHPYHQNLPRHYFDSNGVSTVVKHAQVKTREVLQLIHSIQLEERLYHDKEEGEDDKQCDDEMDLGQVDVEDLIRHKNTLTSIRKKCARINTSLANLGVLKYAFNISQEEICKILLHILKLLTATVKITHDKERKHVQLRIEEVGYIHDKDRVDDSRIETQQTQVELELGETFALPAPARESLLKAAISILSKKSLLRSMSNTSISIPTEEENNSSLLVIHWKVLLRMLIRTAPYLDDHTQGHFSYANESATSQNIAIKKTVQMIRSLRRFFDQGPDVKQNILTDKTAREVWEMVRPDLIHHTHSNSCFRAAIMLYLFHPSRCSASFYKEVMPQWLESWTSVDRCPDFDFIWFTMFCRARKYLKPDDYCWRKLRKRILTHCGYWLQIPVSGMSNDKSFPEAQLGRSRAFPSKLKTFVGSGSGYQEGMNFVSKIIKLVVHCVGSYDTLDVDAKTQIEETVSDTPISVSDGTSDLLRFLSFVGPYFNPSNTGPWTFPLGTFLRFLTYELCWRVGIIASDITIQTTHPLVSTEIRAAEPFLSRRIPDHEFPLLLDALLPLCQQALYSKSSHVSRAGESSMLYLAQLDPRRICPPMLDFATKALEVSSVNLTHQAPAAISAIARLILPSLKGDPSSFLRRLPDILRLSLAGIDSNDQNKTIRTLILYRNISSWISVGKSNSEFDPNKSKHVDNNEFNEEIMNASIESLRNSKDYCNALSQLPDRSILQQSMKFLSIHEDGVEDIKYIVDETALAMSDWSLAFLDRIYDILRATGEQEKVGKSGGVARTISTSDVENAKNFCRILKECLTQVFASMDTKTFESALRSVKTFLLDETLPMAQKEASLLCDAIAAARQGSDGNSYSLGLDTLINPLTFHIEKESRKTSLYRIRCLSGAVRNAGSGLLKHKDAIFSTLDFSLNSDDKDIMKAGCKLLRHTLTSQSESYPYVNNCSPEVDENNLPGKSVQLYKNSVGWHIPSGSQIDFVANILRTFVFNRLFALSKGSTFDNDTKDSKKRFDPSEWRTCMKIIRYCIRGASSVLVDPESTSSNGTTHNYDPHEEATLAIISTASNDTKKFFRLLRGQIAQFLGSVMSFISTENNSVMGSSDENFKDEDSRSPRILCSDKKFCKEVVKASNLLLSKRGENLMPSNSASIWEGQQRLLIDEMSSTQMNEIECMLQKASLLSHRGHIYKDLKYLPRRLVVARINIFIDSLKRQSSFEISRRLRKLSCETRKITTSLQDVSILDIFNFIHSNFGPDDTTVLGEESNTSNYALGGYEKIIDGLCSMVCHPIPDVCVTTLGAIYDGATKIGWIFRRRTARLIRALSLSDFGEDRVFGLPSCAEMSKNVDSTSKSKRLAEVVKGVCALLVTPMIVRDIASTEGSRFSLVTTLCDTGHLVSLLPPEEKEQMPYYLHQIFAEFRSHVYSLPRVSQKQEETHLACLQFLLKKLTIQGEQTNDQLNATTINDTDKVIMSSHWKERLLITWFLTTFVDINVTAHENILTQQLWEASFKWIKTNQLIEQRAALGLVGKLIGISFTIRNKNESISDQGPSLIQTNIAQGDFCSNLIRALVHDHKADSSIGGGHKAQWSIGVDLILKDLQQCIAPRAYLFPFHRTGMNSNNFKVQHAQLIQALLIVSGREYSVNGSHKMLAICRDLLQSPPSEDQKNELCTSAEIFAGVGRSLLELVSDDDKEIQNIWDSILLSFLDFAVEKMPISLLGAYFDAIRYIIHNIPAKYFCALNDWIITKIEETMRQEAFDVETEDNENAGATNGQDGFNSQVKWLWLVQGLLIELDHDSRFLGNKQTWYNIPHVAENNLSLNGISDHLHVWNVLKDRLLPLLLDNLSHRYQKCREHIAGCLFRLCYCQRKLCESNLNGIDRKEGIDDVDVGSTIIQALSSLGSMSFTLDTNLHALMTTRRFLSYCIHCGDNRSEYVKHIKPLIPLAFQAITLSDTEADVPSITRLLQAEVVKSYRYTISEISSACMITFDGAEDVISSLLTTLDKISKHECWQVRQAVSHFQRSFQGIHKYVLSESQTKKTSRIVAKLLSDLRSEVSSASLSTLTGILAATSTAEVSNRVEKYTKKANRAITLGRRKHSTETAATEEETRLANQQISVFFLCAAILSQPYDTPEFVPKALAAISKHSFERNAPLNIRETVKRCCNDYKRTHMSDNWEIHRQQFTRDELDALDDVVSAPHYYA